MNKFFSHRRKTFAVTSLTVIDEESNRAVLRRVRVTNDDVDQERSNDNKTSPQQILVNLSKRPAASSSHLSQSVKQNRSRRDDSSGDSVGEHDDYDRDYENDHNDSYYDDQHEDSEYDSDDVSDKEEIALKKRGPYKKRKNTGKISFLEKYVHSEISPYRKWIEYNQEKDILFCRLCITVGEKVRNK